MTLKPTAHSFLFLGRTAKLGPLTGLGRPGPPLAGSFLHSPTGPTCLSVDPLGLSQSPSDTSSIRTPGGGCWRPRRGALEPRRAVQGAARRGARREAAACVRTRRGRVAARSCRANSERDNASAASRARTEEAAELSRRLV